MKIYADFDLSQLLWYRIGGKTKYLLVCKSRDDIVQALTFIKKNQIKNLFVCGLGSNLIFTDNYFDGAVIQITVDPHPEALANDLLVLKKDTTRFFANAQNAESNVIEAYAGVLLDDVIQFGFAHGLTGLEWAGGLPGTVGAAVRGNVGAFGGEIKDVIESVEVLDYTTGDPDLRTFNNHDLHFVYRGSLVKTYKQMIVISAQFHLHPATKEELTVAQDIYKKNIHYRQAHHPLEYPNCGSVFKNLKDKEQIEKVLARYPDLQKNVSTKWHGKIAVASLIERLGLKGYRIGDAQVSEKHALFIINLGHAKARDVLQIIHDIQEKFQETFGFQLETEVEIVK